MRGNKIGVIIVTLGALIIIFLLGILIFVKPAKEPKNTESIFRGPTSAPRVGGPEDMPPQ